MIRRVQALATVGIGAVIVAGLFAAGQLGGLRINLTPSYPLGIWRIVPLEREVAVGDLIFICPPPNAVFETARKRGYLHRGLCPGGLSPLIKTVAAIGGQRIEVVASVKIDGRPLAFSRVRPTDAGGRVLSAFAGGVVPAGHLFLHSEFAGSYDSRYFGPIPAEGILGLARPVITLGQRMAVHVGVDSCRIGCRGLERRCARTLPPSCTQRRGRSARAGSIKSDCKRAKSVIYDTI